MPLQGKHCLLTKSGDLASGTIKIFEDFGAKVRNLPMIETVPSQAHIDGKFLNLLDKVDFIIFSSPTGARLFREQVSTWPKAVIPIAVGPGTARIISENLGVQPLLPASFDQEGLVELIRTKQPGKRGLYFGAKTKRGLLARALQDMGIELTDFVAYTTQCRDLAQSEVLQAVDWADLVGFFSPSGVNCMHRVLGDAMHRALANKRIAAIGHVTAKPLKNMGFSVTVPQTHTPAAMAKELDRA